MYVTNLTNNKLGIDGRLNLAPREVNRYIDNENTDLVARVLRLESARLVSVIRETGLTKTGITGKVVKTIGVDTNALSKAPRTKKTAATTVKTEVKAEDTTTTVAAQNEATETVKSTSKTATTRRKAATKAAKADTEASTAASTEE